MLCKNHNLKGDVGNMSDNKDNMNKITNDELGEVAGGANNEDKNKLESIIKSMPLPLITYGISPSLHLRNVLISYTKSKCVKSDKTTDNKASEACEKITNDE